MATALVALAVGAAKAGIEAEADGKKRQARPEGPCGDGTARSNRCRKDGDCCTGICRTVRKKDGKTVSRCRCNQRGQSCAEDRNCCNNLTCVQGKCKGSGSGGDGGGGGDKPVVITVGPNDDLQAAIDNAPPGAIVVLQAGAYTRNLKVEKSLTVRSGAAGLESRGRAFAAVDTVTMQNSTDGSRAIEVTGAGVKLTLENVTVAMNSSFSTGGGIKVTAGAALDLIGATRVVDSRFTLCDAAETNSGGAVCLIGASASRIADTVVINANEASPATLLGGGIYVKNSTLTIDGTTQVTGNKADHGAGVYAAGTSTLTVQGNAKIDGNIAAAGGGGIEGMDSAVVSVISTAEITNNSVSGSSSDGGGGIRFAGSGTLTVGGKVKSNSVASGPGGGIAVGGSATCGIDGGTVESNNSEGMGGGIYFNSTGLLLFSNTVTIKSNTSNGYDGGGVALNSGAASMTGATSITLNDASQGGGMYINLATGPTITGTLLISNNTAATLAGGVYQTDLDVNANPAFTASTVTGNTDISTTCANYAIYNVDCILT